MNILEAAQSESVIAAALAYAEMGLSVLPLHGKKPPVAGGLPMSWAKRQLERAPMSMIHEWARRGLLQNAGIVCGAVSGNLVVIDLDGDAAVEKFYSIFEGDLTRTFTVLTGSGHGRHLYYRCDNLPTTTRTKGFELRANGCYVVAPPSIHPETGQSYAPLLTGGLSAVLHVSNLAAIQSWIRSKIPAAPPRSSERVAPPTMNRTIGFDYGGRALASEIRVVSSAAEGQRNNLLNRAAYNLGQLVADGALTRVQVESALLGAALAVGLDEATSLRTINSGLTAGMQKPRSEMLRSRGKQS